MDVARLTVEEVRACVKQLPSEALVELVKGPIDGDDKCRLCDVLVPIEKALPAAWSLVEWHDSLGDAKKMADVLEREVSYPSRAKMEKVAAWWNEIIGGVAYVRCMAVYIAAEAELARRAQAALDNVQ
jgi:hypothetical protein